MTTALRIAEKLRACRPHYESLRELREALRVRDLSELEWSALERRLQLTLECALDVGDMIIAWKQLPRAQRYADVFRTLGDAGVIESGLAQRLIPAAKLRNVLVHMYDKLDRSVVRQAMERGLDDIDAYARAIADYLAKQA